jgi:hypothetical protein
MLGPRFAKAMLERYKLEPKFGWGHAQFKRDLADEIEALQIDSSWRPNEVIRYIAKLVRNS